MLEKYMIKKRNFKPVKKPKIMKKFNSNLISSSRYVLIELDLLLTNDSIKLL